MRIRKGRDRMRKRDWRWRGSVIEEVEFKYLGQSRFR